MDGPIEQLKETAREIEKRREDLKEAGYHIGQAIRILEDSDDLVRVTISEPAVERSGRGPTEEADPPERDLAERDKVRWDDPPEDEKEEPPDDPISVAGRKAPTKYKNLTTTTSITHVLGRAGHPIPATKVHEMLNAGGKEITLATTRAALSSMRTSLKCERIKVDDDAKGPRKVTHYSLLPVGELV